MASQGPNVFWIERIFAFCLIVFAFVNVFFNSSKKHFQEIPICLSNSLLTKHKQIGRSSTDTGTESFLNNSDYFSIKSKSLRKFVCLFVLKGGLQTFANLLVFLIVFQNTQYFFLVEHQCVLTFVL